MSKKKESADTKQFLREESGSLLSEIFVLLHDQENILLPILQECEDPNNDPFVAIIRELHQTEENSKKEDSRDALRVYLNSIDAKRVVENDL